MTRQEIESLVDLAISRHNVEVLRMFNQVSLQIERIPSMVDSKIATFNETQIARRRWGFKSFLSVTAILVSLGAVVLKYFVEV